MRPKEFIVSHLKGLPFILLAGFLFVLGILFLNKKLTQEPSDLQSYVEVKVPRSEMQIEEEEIVRLVTGEYPPYVSTKLAGGGFHQRIVEAALKAVGVDYTIEYYPWARGLKMVDEGEVLGSFPWSKTQEKLEKYIFAEPIYRNENESFVMYYYKGLNDYAYLEGAELEAFREISIGGLFDYFYVELFKEAGIALDLSSEEGEVFEKLIRGRIGMIPTDRYVGSYIIKRDYPQEEDQFKTIEVPFLNREDDYTILINKDHPKGAWFIEKFYVGLKMIKDNGTYDRILEEDPYFD